MEEQGVDQSPVGMRPGGMGHQAGRLVESQQPVVLEQDRERDVLRRRGRVRMGAGQEDLHLGAQAGARRRPRHRDPVEADQPGADPPLDPGAGHARDAREALRHEAVEPLVRVGAAGPERS
jgi:hypothetical protein